MIVVPLPVPAQPVNHPLHLLVRGLNLAHLELHPKGRELLLSLPTRSLRRRSRGRKAGPVRYHTTTSAVAVLCVVELNPAVEKTQAKGRQEVIVGG